MNIIYSTALVALISGSLQAQTNENFEDGDFQGWNTTGTVTIDSNRSIDNYSMRLKGGATAQRAFGAAGDVQLSMAASSLETGNRCEAYLSVDGINWGSPVFVLQNGQDTGLFSSQTISHDQASTHVRFVQVGSSADYCYADNIILTPPADPEPELSAPSTVQFGSITLGASAQKTVTLQNTGTATLTINSVSLGSNDAFSIEQNNCSDVAAGNDCNVVISFTPNTSDSFNDSLNIASNGGDANVSLLGQGVDPSEPPAPSSLPTFNGNGDTGRSELSIATLQSSSLSRLDYGHYSHGTTEMDAASSNAMEPTNVFSGRLILNNANEIVLNFDERTSGKAQAGAYDSPGSLPPIDIELVQEGSHIIPTQRGLIVTGDGDWNYIFEPGRVWDEQGDNGYSRVAIPFAVQEDQANCTHNGMITFAFKNDGSITNAAMQIGAETCLYFQFDAWGMVSAQYQNQTVTNQSEVIANYSQELDTRIETRPISELSLIEPSIVVANIASEQQSSPTTHGVFWDGVHYAANCSTRYGDYPFCEVMSLPSYSTSKTATAGFAHAWLTQQFGDDARYASVSDLVAECQDGINGTASIWSDVTVENLLDMATGNYRLASYQGDEGSSNVLNNFFLVHTHAQKIAHACERYIRKSPPNTHFSYHSSDTYIAGVAMENYYTEGDLFDALVENVYKPLQLSPATYTSVRTKGSPAHAFWSHGMTWHKDDMLKLAKVIYDGGVIDGQQVLDAAIMDDMLLKSGELGLETYGSESTYINTVWTYDMGQRSSPICPAGSWVSYMSGYGGIGIVMFPNGAIFYFVSDSDAYAFGGAESELHKLGDICQMQ